MREVVYQTSLQLVGTSLAIIIPLKYLKKGKIGFGCLLEVFINPKTSKKIIFKDKDVFLTSVKSIGGSQGFYVGKEVVDDLKLKKGDWVEVFYKVRK
jgi:antitoxin component of MazEF toxin-antitoxin module